MPRMIDRLGGHYSLGASVPRGQNESKTLENRFFHRRGGPWVGRASPEDARPEPCWEEKPIIIIRITMVTWEYRHYAVKSMILGKWESPGGHDRLGLCIQKGFGCSPVHSGTKWFCLFLSSQIHENLYVLWLMI